MSQELERVYTINLGKVKISQSQHRAVRAINMIREFARHHMKVETIKIEEELAHEIWAKGVRNPPRKIRVRMSKTDEGHVLVSKYDEDAESKITPKKETPAVSDKVKEPTEKAAETEEPTEKAAEIEEATEKAAENEEPAKKAAENEEPAKKISDNEKPSAKAQQNEEPAKKVAETEEPSKKTPETEEPTKKAPQNEEPSAKTPQKD